MNNTMFNDDFKAFLEWVTENASVPFNLPDTLESRAQECLDNFHNGKTLAFVEVRQRLDALRLTPVSDNNPIAAKDARIAELEAQLAELTAPKPVETFESELLTGSFSSYWEGFIDPYGTVIVFHFHYDGGYEKVIVLPEIWEENEKALEASIGKEITIKATWQDDELEFIFDSIVETESESK